MLRKALYFILDTAICCYFLQMHNNLTISNYVIALIAMIVASSIQVCIHECGHLVGGWLTGYKLIELQIGIVSLEAKRNGYSFRLKRSTGSFCAMRPAQECKEKFVAYNLGGVAANIVASSLGGLLLQYRTPFVSLLGLQLMLVGIDKIFKNIIPKMKEKIPNDGYVVKLLLQNAETRHDYAMYLNLYSKMLLNEEVDINSYSYDRISEEDEYLLYYNEIQSMLETLKKDAKPVISDANLKTQTHDSSRGGLLRQPE